MNWKSVTDVADTLNGAISEKLCVQTWVGHAQVLFIGFGDEVLLPPPPGEMHAKPPYELQTGFTDWWIQDEHGVLATSNDEKNVAEAVLATLVGRQVAHWYFDSDSLALRICFEGGLELRMAPYSEGDVSQEDAWILRDPVHYGFVTWDGAIGIGRRDHYFTDDK